MLDFSKLQEYDAKWQQVDSRSFNERDKSLIASARVVNSDYGYSVCFLMKSGKNTYVPLSKMSSLLPGDAVDLDSAKIITLAKEGNEDIYRIDA